MTDNAFIDPLWMYGNSSSSQGWKATYLCPSFLQSAHSEVLKLFQSEAEYTSSKGEWAANSQLASGYGEAS